MKTTLKMMTSPKVKTTPKIEESPKLKMTPKKLGQPKSENNQSKADLRPEILFSVETRNRNPHVNKHDSQHRANVKDDILNAKTTNAKM